MIYTTLKKVIDFHRALAVDSFKLPVTNPDGNASAICIRQTDYEFPLTQWMAMGLNDKSNGVYNTKDAVANVKLKTKAGDVYKKAIQEDMPARKGIGIVSAAALESDVANRTQIAQIHRIATPAVK